MSSPSEKLKELAELNFCKNCYPKYLEIIQPTIEYLLSEPIADWRDTEQNINIFWIKANGLHTVKSGVISICENALQEARSPRNPMNKKLKFLKKEGVIKEHTYKFLDKARKRRNKIHPPLKFLKQDYFMFHEAKRITDAMYVIIIHDLNYEPWKSNLIGIEKYAKQLLGKTNSF